MAEGRFLAGCYTPRHSCGPRILEKACRAWLTVIVLKFGHRYLHGVSASASRLRTGTGLFPGAFMSFVA